MLMISQLQGVADTKAKIATDAFDATACLYAVGETMAPWREPGELVVVDRVNPPRPGEYVVMALWGVSGGDDVLIVKRLVTLHENGGATVEQINPPQRADIPTESIRRMWRVLPMQELFLR